MCVSNGIEITCAFRKVKLADGFGKKTMYSYMDDESMQKSNNPGEWGM